MPSRNTKHCRTRGYSSLKELRAKNKNYSTSTGHTFDTAAGRKAAGKAPANPSTANDAHWKYDKHEDRIRREHQFPVCRHTKAKNQ